MKADRLIFDPGEGWAYSNVGYFFVRQLIEKRSTWRLTKRCACLFSNQWAFTARGLPTRPMTWRRRTGAIQMATIQGGFIMAS